MNTMITSQVEHDNNCWSCERIIQLLDDTRLSDAKAIAAEWNYPWDEDDTPVDCSKLNVKIFDGKGKV